MSQHPFEPDERGLVRTCPSCGQLNRLTYERLGNVFRCASCKTELSPPAQPVEAPSATAFDALIARASVPVLVDFWASWCGPCRTIAPELVKVAQSSSGRWLVAKVSTEALPDLAQRFDIQSIPTLAIFQNGRETARQSGALSAAGMVRFMESAVSSA